MPTRAEAAVRPQRSPPLSITIMPSDTYRLFIAINLPADLLAGLQTLQQRLMRQLADAPLRWVRPEGIHLTLKFLGETDAGRVQEIVKALEKDVAASRPFELPVGGLGCFPNIRNPNVLWVGVADEEQRLRKLAAEVDRTLVGLGWPPERRPFSGHLTLARVRKQAGRKERRILGEQISALSGAEKLGVLPVYSVHLMRSQLHRDGAIYTALAEVALTGEGANG
ncbi:MAG: RNA 2',3'-cyclic phosphodiesterase [Caldilineae bacterium]|nr:MAG: RNA 2',3'-cyclic phosphodiesterase [Caldilineae bacterium]